MDAFASRSEATITDTKLHVSTQLAELLLAYDSVTLIHDESSKLQEKYASASTEGYEAEKLDGYLFLLKQHISEKTGWELRARFYAIGYLVTFTEYSYLAF
jgi:hypothetical protein